MLGRRACFALALNGWYILEIILKSINGLGEMIPGTLEGPTVN